MERLLTLLFAPLLLATSKKKKTTTTRKSKSVKRASAKKSKPSARVGKKRAQASKPSAPSKVKREKLKLPAQPTTVAQTQISEPVVKPAPPTGRAILISPENDKFADSVHPTFRWLSVGGATRYEVAWSDSPDWSQSHSIISIATEATVPVEKPLRLGVTYYWRVRGGNESGWGPWSSSASFRVLENEGNA
jgi:hypothetical protein